MEKVSEISQEKTIEKEDELSLEIFDFNLLKVYNPEPPIDAKLFNNSEFCTQIVDVFERSSRLEHVEKIRIRKVTATANKYLSQYTHTIRDRCRFCSSIEVPIINPHFICVRCWRSVCKTCIFSIDWNERQRVICAHCLCTINRDNRTGKWFTILSEESDRKRISPKNYLMPLLKKRKKKIVKKERIKGKWVHIDVAIAEWNEEERSHNKSRQNSISNDSQQISASSGRKSSLESSNSGDTQTSTVTLSINYDQEESTFKIHVMHCMYLPRGKDRMPNAYIKLNIEPEYLNKKKKPRTKTVMDDCNPRFDELLTIRISQNKMKNGNLIVTIYNFNKNSKNSMLGEVIIPIQQTLTTSNGKFQTYKMKSTETLLSSMVDKKMRITRLMDSLSKSPLFYEKESSDCIQPDKDMFESFTHMLTKVKCDLMNQTSAYTIELYLDKLSDIQKILDSTRQILISGIFKNANDEEFLSTEKTSIHIKSLSESIVVDRKLLFSNIDSSLEIDSMEIQLQVFTVDGYILAKSYNSTANFLKNIKKDRGVWLPINFKLRKS